MKRIKAVPITQKLLEKSGIPVRLEVRVMARMFKQRLNKVTTGKERSGGQLKVSSKVRVGQTKVK